jgi:lipoate-protein ligase B
MGFKKEWLIAELGLMGYQDAHRLQVNLVEARHSNLFHDDIVLMLEHPPVFTMGRRGGQQNLIIDEQELIARGIEMAHIERGGDITFHGPGQLVCYLIIDHRASNLDIPGFVKNIEEVMIRLAKNEDVKAGRDPQNPGVWVGKEKLGSIGIAIRHGITFHGFALNVNMDLTPFKWIHPCGLKNVVMTSLSVLKNSDVSMSSARENAKKHLKDVFHVRLKSIDSERINSFF